VAACRLAQDLWDDELWHVLATRRVRLARDTGALNLLTNALNDLAALDVHPGAFATAAAMIDEVDAITKVTGLPRRRRWRLETPHGSCSPSGRSRDGTYRSPGTSPSD
jgi:hypothetical protein